MPKAPQSAIWHPYTPGIGGAELHIERAEGAFLFEKSGRKIIDAISSWWVTLHGHSHPYIAAAIARQAATLEQVIFAGFTHSPAEDLATAVLNLLGADSGFTRVFYSDNGSTAVEVAIKMALQHHFINKSRKTTILALGNSYHGDTFGAMAVGARGAFSEPFQDWLFDVVFLDPPYCSHVEDLLEQVGEENLFKAEQLLKSGEVAALIVEPLIQGAAGMRVYAKSWLNRLFTLAKSYHVPIIADEVFTGFFRTGKAFAFQHLEVRPDIICLSKGLTGGFLPLGLTVCTDQIAAPFFQADYEHTLYHGHSFTANPMACAAAVANIELIQRPDFEENLARICKEQSLLFEKIREHFPQTNPRILGTIVALSLEEEGGLSYTHPLRKVIYTYFIERDLLLRPIGNVLYVVPPMCISTEDLHRIYDEIVSFLRSFYTP